MLNRSPLGAGLGAGASDLGAGASDLGAGASDLGAGASDLAAGLVPAAGPVPICLRLIANM